jgi:hypothetical protein
MENAEIADNVDLRRWYLSFVIVGGGFSGVEVAGEINDLVRDTYKYYPEGGDKRHSDPFAESDPARGYFGPQGFLQNKDGAGEYQDSA